MLVGDPHPAQTLLACGIAENGTLELADADEIQTPPTPLRTREIVERDALFRTLVEAHGTRLHRFIIKNIGNTTDAEDLAQQAFLEAVRSYATFRGQSELSTWLYGIAMNLVRNHLSRAPHRRYEFADESELAELEGQTLSPAQAVEQAQHMGHLEAAMAELPESMRDILLMVAVDELSYEEAAALLTVPVGTVRSRLSRARSALRTRLTARGVVLDL
jgi:RNA polymerase sigma factor (sigma-70 family)